VTTATSARGRDFTPRVDAGVVDTYDGVFLWTTDDRLGGIEYVSNSERMATELPDPVRFVFPLWVMRGDRVSVRAVSVKDGTVPWEGAAQDESSVVEGRFPEVAPGGTGIESYLAVIARDLMAGGIPVPRIGPTSWQTYEPSESVMLFVDDGSGTGVWVDLDMSEAHRLAHLAEQVQDWAVEELARLRRPTNWPVCPAHPDNHPLEAAVEDGRAVWVCPAGDGVSVPIGGLGLPAGF